MLTAASTVTLFVAAAPTRFSPCLIQIQNHIQTIASCIDASFTFFNRQRTRMEVKSFHFYALAAVMASTVQICMGAGLFNLFCRCMHSYIKEVGLGFLNVWPNFYSKRFPYNVSQKFVSHLNGCCEGTAVHFFLYLTELQTIETNDFKSFVLLFVPFWALW